MSRQKVTTMRLPEVMAAQLVVIARIEGVPVSEFVRQAIENQIAVTRADEGFKERLKQRLVEDRETLKGLGVEDV